MLKPARAVPRAPASAARPAPRLRPVTPDPTGAWSVVDPGSENGTLLNGNTIPANQAVALHDGDRIHLGAWTALTITRDPEVIGG